MAEIEKYLNIKYKLNKSENFDEFMKAVGVGFITRKAASATSPVAELKKEDDMYVFENNSTFKNMILKFKPGEEFEQTTPDGRVTKTVITIEGNQLIEIQKDKEIKVVRTFSDNELKMDLSIGDVSALRLYKKLE